MTVTTRTAFVAGATGYAGNAVVAELRRRGVTTVAHVRPDSPRLRYWHDHFEARGAAVDSTPWAEDALAGTFARVRPDAVFALLGTTRRRMRDARGDSYASVDYGLTAMLLRAVRRAAASARFVYLSAIGAGPRARGEYLRVRWRLEQELRDSGIDWLIARPAFITGADRAEGRPLERIAARATDGALRIAAALGAPGLHARYASLDAATLARGLVHHAFAPGSSRQVIDAGALRQPHVADVKSHG
ncbi:MAG TPA: NAD(P)H-binding protein [Longimicrobiales bacterium]